MRYRRDSLKRQRVSECPSIWHRNILPALCNEGISLLKETSIAGYIGIVDVTKAAMLIRSQTYSAFVPLIGVALIYLVIVLVLQYLVGKLERRLNNAYR